MRTLAVDRRKVLFRTDILIMGSLYNEYSVNTGGVLE